MMNDDAIVLEKWLLDHPNIDIIRAVDQFRKTNNWNTLRLNEAFLTVWTFSNKVTW